MDSSVNPAQSPEVQPEAVAAARSVHAKAILNLVFYALTGELLISLTALVRRSLFPDTQITNTATYLLHFIPLYGIAFPACLLLAKRQKTSPPEKHRISVGQFLCAFLMSLGMAITGAIIGVVVISILMAVFKIDTGTTFLQEGVVSEGAFTLTVIASVFAPVIEEMLFRKLLIDRIRPYGNKAAILLSGFLFGLFHGNFTQFFYAAMLGMFFAFIYIRTGKIHYTILLHCAINFLSTGVTGTLMRKVNLDTQVMLEALEKLDIETLRQYIPLGIYMMFYYLAAFTGLILLIIFRRQFRVDPPEISLPNRKHLSAACLNIGFVLFVSYCISAFVNSALQNG